MKYATFAGVTARYVRLPALSESGNRGQWSSAAEINLHGVAPSAAAGGVWGPMIGFPLVPVSAVSLPNNKLLVFSAVDDMSFTSVSDTITKVAILDLNTGTVTGPSDVNTHHQMFCTGLALLADGRVIINGGSGDRATTIYNPVTNTWSVGPLMNIPRAYNSTAVLSTGQALTLGGSWRDSAGGKNGELFTPSGTGGMWTSLPGVLATNILTADPAGIYRADNHAWLFGDSGGTVFHAGPSKQMNWITTTGSGSITGAGNRSDSQDALNGNAGMYDIGKILRLVEPPLTKTPAPWSIRRPPSGRTQLTSPAVPDSRSASHAQATWPTPAHSATASCYRTARCLLSAVSSTRRPTPTRPESAALSFGVRLPASSLPWLPKPARVTTTASVFYSGTGGCSQAAGAFAVMDVRPTILTVKSLRRRIC